MPDPTYLITLKQNTPREEIKSVKDHFINQGATIGHDYNLTKGFSFSIPESVKIASHENVEIMEKDTEVHTQD